jgi:hypothetical protein
MTLANFHPSATQPVVQCLTPWLRWTIALFAILSDVTPICDEHTRAGFWRGYSVYIYIVYLQIYSVACPVIVYDVVIGLLVNIVFQLNESIYASDTKMSGLSPCAFTLITLLTRTENLLPKNQNALWALCNVLRT